MVFDAVDEGVVGAGVGGSGGVEAGAEGDEGSGAAGGGERVDADVEFVAVDCEVGGGPEGLSEEAAGFVLGSGVVGGEEAGESPWVCWRLGGLVF